MSGSARWGLALLAATWLVGALPALASADADDGARAAWVERLDEARADLHAARRRLQRAALAVESQRRENYPRGAAKAALEQELEQARSALAEAERTLPELIEQAWRAGVPRGTLRRYEDPS